MRKPLAARLSRWIASSFDWIRKRGWIEIEAEVQECTALRYGNYLGRSGIHRGPWGNFLITFTYEVNGRTFDGTTVSPDEVQKGDTFAIRCNPNRPEENNTFDSETNWVSAANWIVMSGIVLAFVTYYAWERLGGK